MWGFPHYNGFLFTPAPRAMLALVYHCNKNRLELWWDNHKGHLGHVRSFLLYAELWIALDWIVVGTKLFHLF